MAESDALSTDFSSASSEQTESGTTENADSYSDVSSESADLSESRSIDQSVSRSAEQSESQCTDQSDTDNPNSVQDKYDRTAILNNVDLVTAHVMKSSIRNARELVQNQERLLAMLQNMKSDILKMEREAQYIREDVIRSRQFVHVVIERKEAHHLQPTADGYNMSYSVPRVSYPVNREFDADLNMRYLKQLSVRPPSKSSMNMERRRSRQQSGSGFLRPVSLSRLSRRSHSENRGSETDSEYEQYLSRDWPRTFGSVSVLSRDSGDGGSDTSSCYSSGTENSRRRRWMSGSSDGAAASCRRSSYFLTGLRNTQSPEPVDDINL